MPCRNNQWLARVSLLLLCCNTACTPQVQSSRETQSALSTSTASPHDASTSNALELDTEDSVAAGAQKAQSNKSLVQAEALTGTYELVAENKQRKNILKVLALGGNKLKVKFEGLWEYSYNGEPIANVGEVEGIAVLEGNTAILKPEAAPSCKIVLKFTNDKLLVEQESECGFGQHVNASGQYLRRSKKPPTFRESE